MKYKVGDNVIYDNDGGKPRPAMVIDVHHSSPTSNPYHIAVPYLHLTYGTPMKMNVWVQESNISPTPTKFITTTGMTTDEELQACREYYDKTYNRKETPEEAYDRAMGVV